jgi:hypothetical protein
MCSQQPTCGTEVQQAQTLIPGGLSGFNILVVFEALQQVQAAPLVGDIRISCMACRH